MEYKEIGIDVRLQNLFRGSLPNDTIVKENQNSSSERNSQEAIEAPNMKEEETVGRISECWCLVPG